MLLKRRLKSILADDTVYNLLDLYKYIRLTIFLLYELKIEKLLDLHKRPQYFFAYIQNCSIFNRTQSELRLGKSSSSDFMSKKVEVLQHFAMPTSK